MLTKTLFLVVLLFVLSCASTRTLTAGRATVTMTRADATELHEAFKTTSDKKVALPTLGEASCSEGSCWIPVRGLATVLEDGQPRGTDHVRGTLIFVPPAMRQLADMMDEAKDQDRDSQQIAENGEVTCSGDKCVLEFTLTPNTDVIVDAANNHILWRAR